MRRSTYQMNCQLRERQAPMGKTQVHVIDQFESHAPRMQSAAELGPAPRHEELTTVECTSSDGLMLATSALLSQSVLRHARVQQSRHNEIAEGTTETALMVSDRG